MNYEAELNMTRCAAHGPRIYVSIGAATIQLYVPVVTQPRDSYNPFTNVTAKRPARKTFTDAFQAAE